MAAARRGEGSYVAGGGYIVVSVASGVSLRRAWRRETEVAVMPLVCARGQIDKGQTIMLQLRAIVCSGRTIDCLASRRYNDLRHAIHGFDPAATSQ
jgi:hypothetical protein